MREHEDRFVVNASPVELWGFVRDVHALCSCIPGVEEVRLVDDRTAELTVKERIGVVPLVVDLRAQIDSEDPPNRLHVIATAEHLTMEIEVVLHASGAGTEMLGRVRVNGEGPLKPVVDSLFERRAKERAAQFAEHLERRFGAIVPAAAPAPGAARGLLARLAAWIGGLWRRIVGRAGPKVD